MERRRISFLNGSSFEGIVRRSRRGGSLERIARRTVLRSAPKRRARLLDRLAGQHGQREPKMSIFEDVPTAVYQRQRRSGLIDRER